MKHLLLIASLLCIGLCGQDAVKRGTVAAEKLTIRAKAGTNFENLGSLVKSQELEIVSEKGEWLEIRLPEGTKVWISADAIDDTGTVLENGGTLYCGPAVVYTSLCKVKAGEKLTLTGGKSGPWRGVIAPAHATAWVSKAFVTLLEDTAKPAQETPAEEPAKTTEVLQAQQENKPAIIHLVVPDKTKELSEKNEQTEAKLRQEQEKNQELEGKLQETQAQQNQLETKLQEARKKADEAEQKIKAIEAQWAAAENAQKEAVETERPAQATAKPAPEPPKPAPVPAVVQLPTFTGYIMPLPRGNHLATHVLYTINGNKKQFVCYLNSKLQLNDWNGTRVKVSGRLSRPKGWTLDVLTVRSIICD